MSEVVYPVRLIQGEIRVPPDKSISHRAVLIGSITEGDLIVENFLRAEDCLATVNAMRILGVPVEEGETGELRIRGVGLHGLKQPASAIDRMSVKTVLDAVDSHGDVDLPQASTDVARALAASLVAFSETIAASPQNRLLRDI